MNSSLFLLLATVLRAPLCATIYSSGIVSFSNWITDLNTLKRRIWNADPNHIEKHPLIIAWISTTNSYLFIHTDTFFIWRLLHSEWQLLPISLQNIWIPSYFRLVLLLPSIPRNNPLSHLWVMQSEGQFPNVNNWKNCLV